MLYDSNMTLVGKISDIFGPKSRFFISIKPIKSEYLAAFASRTNEPLYTDPSEQNKRSGSKSRKSKSYQGRSRSQRNTGNKRQTDSRSKTRSSDNTSRRQSYANKK